MRGTAKRTTANLTHDCPLVNAFQVYLLSLGRFRNETRRRACTYQSIIIQNNLTTNIVNKKQSSFQERAHTRPSLLPHRCHHLGPVCCCCCASSVALFSIASSFSSVTDWVCVHEYHDRYDIQRRHVRSLPFVLRPHLEYTLPHIGNRPSLPQCNRWLHIDSVAKMIRRHGDGHFPRCEWMASMPSSHSARGKYSLRR